MFVVSSGEWTFSGPQFEQARLPEDCTDWLVTGVLCCGWAKGSRAGSSFGRALICTLQRLSDYNQIGKVPVHEFSELLISGTLVRLNI